MFPGVSCGHGHAEHDESDDYFYKHAARHLVQFSFVKNRSNSECVYKTMKIKPQLVNTSLVVVVVYMLYSKHMLNNLDMPFHS